MASITAYALYVSVGEYLKTGRVVVGEVVVNTEFPVHGFSKLVTYLNDSVGGRMVLCD